MALDCAEVRVGLTGHLYTAPVGTPGPTDVSTPLPPPWVELGYTTEDGVSLSVDQDREDFAVWQSVNPCRSVITSQTLTSTFTLVQRNANTLKVAFGGGEVVAGTEAGVVIYRPPPVSLLERAFVYEVIDGEIIDRYVLFRGNPGLGGEINFQRGEMTGYEIEVTHLDSADGVWQLVSNDDNIEVDPEIEGSMASVEGEGGEGEMATAGAGAGGGGGTAFYDES